MKKWRCDLSLRKYPSRTAGVSLGGVEYEESVKNMRRMKVKQKKIFIIRSIFMGKLIREVKAWK